MSTLTPVADIRASHAPAVVILGNDAQLAARPATPVQLAHACLAAGFEAAVPASWGDELVASATLAVLSRGGARPAIHCSCPHAARRILASGSELVPHLVSLVAPPVAAARYLRLHSTGELRVTYVGRCPAAADDSIDARLTPEELLAQFSDRGIDLIAQPEVFESVLPPDRRRHLSQPGGLPSAEVLWTRARCATAAVNGSDFASELADLILAGSDTLIDPALAVGCVCSGVVRGTDSLGARAAVTALEPPRAAHSVVEEAGAPRLDLVLPVLARAVTDLVSEAAAAPTPDVQRILDGPADALGDAPPSPPVTPSRRPRLTPPGMVSITTLSAAGATQPVVAPRRRSPVGSPRIPGPLPVSSDSEGRLLPRAYVARRRSPRSGVPVISELHEPNNRGISVSSAVRAGSAEAVTTEPPGPALGARPVALLGPDLASQSRRRGAGDRELAGQDADPGFAPPDSERPVVRSIEPPTPRVIPPTADPVVVPVSGERAPPAPMIAESADSPVAAALVPPSVAVAPDVRQAAIHSRSPAVAAWRAGVRHAASMFGQHSGLAVVGVLTGAALLLGVAIGYSAARHSRSGPQALGDADHGNDSASATAPRAPIVQESISAGGIARLPAAARRPSSRAVTRTRSTGRSRPSVLSPAPLTEPGAVNSVPLPNATNSPAVIESSASSAAGAGTVTVRDRAPPDSVAGSRALSAERDSIRRDIGRRRARVDSIERARLRLDSIQRASQGANPP